MHNKRNIDYSQLHNEVYPVDDHEETKSILSIIKLRILSFFERKVND